MASLVLGVAGAAVGTMLGMPGLGYMVGSALGAALFPPPVTQGPRLNDLKAQASQYGNMIPVVYNIDRVAGQMIWADDMVRHDEQIDSGSGGGGYTQYTYTQSFAVSVCEGAKGIRKIWADGKKIYDVDVLKHAFKATSFVQYPGTETQLPDPTMEAILGKGNVPAYRGQTYCVFTDLVLGKYGNRIPNFTFEVGPVIQPLPHIDIIDPVTTDLTGDQTGYGSRPVGMPFVSSTGYIWEFAGADYAEHRLFPPSMFAILDPNQHMKVVGYTSGDSGFWKTATVADAPLIPPSTDAEYYAAISPTNAAGYGINENEYIVVPAGASGVWAGHQNQLAKRVNGLWEYITPTLNMFIFDYAAAGNQTTYQFNGAYWVEFDPYTSFDQHINDPSTGVYLNYVDYDKNTDTVVCYDEYHGTFRKYDGTSGVCLLEKVFPPDFDSRDSTFTRPVDGAFGAMGTDPVNGDLWWLYEVTNTPEFPYSDYHITSGRFLKHISRQTLTVLDTFDTKIVSGDKDISDSFGDGRVVVGENWVFICGQDIRPDPTGASNIQQMNFIKRVDKTFGLAQKIYKTTWGSRNQIGSMVLDTFRNQLHIYDVIGPVAVYDQNTNTNTFGPSVYKVTVIDANTLEGIMVLDDASRPDLSLDLYGSSGELMSVFNMQQEKTYDPYSDCIWMRCYLPGWSGYPRKADQTVIRAFDPETYEIVLESDPIDTYDWMTPISVAPHHTVQIVDGGGSTTFLHFQWGLNIPSAILNLGEIVRDISLRTGLVSSEVNSSDLDQSVRGYALATIMPGRSAIEPLAIAYFFDAVESNGVVKYVRRGILPSLTLNSTDIVMEDQP